MKSRKPRTLTFYVYLLLLGMSLIIGSLFTMSYSYTLRVLREQMYETNRSTLSMYATNIDEGVQNAERFLSGFAYNDADLALLSSDRPIDYYLGISREQTKLTEALPSHSMIDGFFVYNAKNDLFAAAYQNGISDSEYRSIRESLRETLSDPPGFQHNRWLTYKVEGRDYLLRLLRISGSYVGALIKVENIIAPLSATPLGRDAMVYLYHDDQPLSGYGRLAPEFAPSSAAQQFVLIGDSDRYLAVSWQCLEKDFYIVALIPDSSIQNSLSGVYKMLILVVVLLGVFILALYFAIRRFFVYPISGIVNTIKKVRDGHLGAQIADTTYTQEFTEVADSFNQMSSEIKELKISVYEQQLGRQKMYMEYLKQQITPHFYINCLNTIYSMAGLGKTDLVRTLSKELSQHLRYTMNSQTLVELGNEMEHVRNYVDLTRIRYPDTLNCELEIDPAVNATLLPPLTIQSFVENTVKHEMIMGEPIFIHISADLYWQSNNKRVHICIWDTGEGYPAEVLARLEKEVARAGHDFELGDGRHIGLTNTIQRLKTQFGDDAAIRFSNREGAGAQCDIIIPYTTIPIPANEEEII